MVAVIVACSAAVAWDGEAQSIYVSGSNDHGQLGLGAASTEPALAFIRLPAFSFRVRRAASAPILGITTPLSLTMIVYGITGAPCGMWVAAHCDSQRVWQGVRVWEQQQRPVWPQRPNSPFNVH